jgi:hypothetical protein
MVTLREAGCNFCRWTVEVLFDGEGNMYLHTSWKKFVRDHDVKVGCLLNFFYEGDGDMSVKVYDKESCCIHYHSGSDDDNHVDGCEED